MTIPESSASNLISGRKMVLISGYWTVYETLFKTLYGEGPLVVALSAQINPAPTQADPKGVRVLAELIRAKAARTVRKIANQSALRGSPVGEFLRKEPGKFLEITADPRFPKLRTKRQSIKSAIDLLEDFGDWLMRPHKQIDFLSRSLGAALAGYEPSTGVRYIPELIAYCEGCKQLPAVIDRVWDTDRWEDENFWRDKHLAWRNQKLTEAEILTEAVELEKQLRHPWCGLC